MAPRLDSLDGKTVYFVDTGFHGSDTLLEQMQIWFKETRPTSRRFSGEKRGLTRKMIRRYGKKSRKRVTRRLWPLALKHLLPSDRRSLHNHGKDGNSERTRNHESI